MSLVQVRVSSSGRYVLAALHAAAMVRLFHVSFTIRPRWEILVAHFTAIRSIFHLVRHFGGRKVSNMTICLCGCCAVRGDRGNTGACCEAGLSVWNWMAKRGLL